MIKSYISDISKTASDAIIPPAGVSLMCFVNFHYMHTQGIESGDIFLINNTLGIIFFMLFNIVYAQTRFEEQSIYNLYFKEGKLLLFESYSEEYPKLVGEINFKDIEQIKQPSHYQYSWFFCWIYYSLKFLKVSHFISYRQLRIKVPSTTKWPNDQRYNNYIMIPFYFPNLNEIHNDLLDYYNKK